MKSESKNEKLSFWVFFISHPKYWIAIIIGAGVLISALLLMDHSQLLSDLLFWIGDLFLIFGLISGIWYAYNEFKQVQLMKRLPRSE